MRLLRIGLGWLVFASSAVVHATDLWQQLDLFTQKTGNAVCALTSLTGADFTRFGTVYNGPQSCRFGWGAEHSPLTQLEFTEKSEVHLQLAIVPGKLNAFAMNGRYNPWGGNNAIGITYQTGGFLWRAGTVCGDTLAQCGYPNLQVGGVF